LHRLPLVLIAFGLCQTLSAQLQVQVTSSLPSPQPVGTEVVFTFSATDTFSNPGFLNYKFEVALPQSTTFVTVRDFEQATTFAWFRNLTEGSYQIRVTARDTNYLTETSQLVVLFKITSRIVASQPVVNATTHPLVALFSAPLCPVGESMDVVFNPVASTAPAFSTTSSSCNGKTSMNFLIGGMLPNATYYMYSQVGIPGGTLQNGPTLTFTSGAIPSTLLTAPVSFPIPFGSSASQKERLSLIGFNTSATPVAVNTSGQILWYYAGNGAFQPGKAAAVQIDRLVAGGFLLTHCGYPGDYTGIGLWGNQEGGGQVIQTIDLTGHVIKETNLDRVNEQLVAMGSPDPISVFNHEVRALPDGDILTVAVIQRIFPAGTQGSTGPINVLGTMLVELNANFQVDWYWDSFEHDGGNGQLDINRPAVLNEQCTSTNAGFDGCPPVMLSIPANDWLHTNTVQYDSLDGSLILSLRNQDWVAKIDYKNGTGTGNVLWLMGLDGSFALNNVTGDPYPWVSHQHDVEYQNGGNTLMTMFDNGNTRVSENGGYSRGYVLSVNEAGLQVTPTLLTSLGVYAVAQGSAQTLANGDYEFMGGQINGLNGITLEEGFELTPAGTIVYTEIARSEAYRMWRMEDFYHVPTN
jgi:arylsulfate sulfotransferase